MLKNDIKSQKSIVGLVKYFLSLFGRMVRTDDLQTFLSDRPGTDCQTWKTPKSLHIPNQIYFA